MVQSVASQLRLTLSPEETALLGKRFTSNAGAYEDYLRANEIFDRRTINAGDRTLEEAIELFRQAVGRDPNYGLAFAQLAYCYAWMALFNDQANPVWIQLARDTVARSIALDPQLAQAHIVRYQIAWSRYEGFDIEGAMRELRLAQEMDPTVGLAELGVTYAHLGFSDASLAALERVIEIDPTSGTPKSRLIEANVLLGRHEEALATARRFNRWMPNDRTVLAFLSRGDYVEARSAVDQALEAMPTDHFMLTSKTLLSALMGSDVLDADLDRAATLAAGGRAFHHTAYNIASTYAVLDRPVEAVEWLRRTVDSGMPNYPLFDRDPVLDLIRSNPGFVEFMNQLRSRWERLRRELEARPAA